MKQEVLLIGIVLVIVGIVLISVFLASSGQSKSKFAVVGFLGPIPFGAGNDSGLVKLAMVLTGIAIAAFLIVGHLLPRLGK